MTKSLQLIYEKPTNFDKRKHGFFYIQNIVLMVDRFSLLRNDENLTIFFNIGFTGHEQLPRHNIINMNARLYDPLTARFLSADSLIPNSGNLVNGFYIVD
jgi:RHS repeat-associated protein